MVDIGDQTFVSRRAIGRAVGESDAGVGCVTLRSSAEASETRKGRADVDKRMVSGNTMYRGSSVRCVRGIGCN